MADKVLLTIEESIANLRYFEDKNIFTREFIQDILEKRENHEYNMIKNKSSKIEFLKSIQYEMDLE